MLWILHSIFLFLFFIEISHHYLKNPIDIKILKEKTEINICAEYKMLSFLGSGYPLYFNYILFCQIILLIVTLTSGEYNLLSNFFGKDCVDSDNKLER
jgi:hypothetical protein